MRVLQHISDGWVNQWAIEFVEPSDTAFDSLLDSSFGDSSMERKYYPRSATFSKSFEDFARNFVITDDQKEDQRKRAWEEVSSLLPSTTTSVCQ